MQRIHRNLVNGSHTTTGQIKYMIKWLNPYHRTYGRAPINQDLDVEIFSTLPDEAASSMEHSNIMAKNPSRPTSGVTFRRSSMMSQGSQTLRDVKVNIADYPKLLGKAKDWIAFERNFWSVASSQGFYHVLQER